MSQAWPAEDCLEAARAGDEAALLRLLVVCRPDLTRYARRACQSDDVEEAVQDALWLLYRRVGGLRAGAALSAWLFQVVRRLCLRLTRRRSSRAVTVELPDEIPGPSAEDGLRLDLVRAIGELPPSYRDVLILRDVQGFEAAEAADQLGISVDAMKSRLHRARGLVREALRPETAARSVRSGSSEPTKIPAQDKGWSTVGPI